MALDGEGAKVIDDAGAGFTCPAEGPDALAQAVLKMYETSKPERDKMGANGRAHYQANFNRDIFRNN